jgi:hypothetical protein
MRLREGGMVIAVCLLHELASNTPEETPQAKNASGRENSCLTSGV